MYYVKNNVFKILPISNVSHVLTGIPLSQDFQTSENCEVPVFKKFSLERIVRSQTVWFDRCTYLFFLNSLLKIPCFDSTFAYKIIVFNTGMIIRTV